MTNPLKPHDPTDVQAWHRWLEDPSIADTLNEAFNGDSLSKVLQYLSRPSANEECRSPLDEVHSLNFDFEEDDHAGQWPPVPLQEALTGWLLASGITPADYDWERLALSAKHPTLLMQVWDAGHRPSPEASVSMLNTMARYASRWTPAFVDEVVALTEGIELPSRLIATCLSSRPDEFSPEFLRRLITAGACVDEPRWDGQLPIHTAATLANADGLLVLLEHGADPMAVMPLPERSDDEEPPMLMIGEMRQATLALSPGNAVKGQTLTTVHTGRLFPLPEVGLLPIHLAAMHATTFATTQALLDRGVSIEATDANGNTPLHWAIERRSMAIVEGLLASGASPDALNVQGQRPTDRPNIFINQSLDDSEDLPGQVETIDRLVEMAILRRTLDVAVHEEPRVRPRL